MMISIDNYEQTRHINSPRSLQAMGVLGISQEDLVPSQLPMIDMSKLQQERTKEFLDRRRAELVQEVKQKRQAVINGKFKPVGAE